MRTREYSCVSVFPWFVTQEGLFVPAMLAVGCELGAGSEMERETRVVGVEGCSTGWPHSMPDLAHQRERGKDRERQTERMRVNEKKKGEIEVEK